MFQCDRCGACCRNLHLSELYRHLDRGDGVCRYLVENLCSIYPNRPLLCRVDESYEVFFRETMSLDEYYKLNYAVCNQLKSQEEYVCPYH
jgi:hypothetical protein